MKATAIILDKGDAPYFGYLKQFPSVCAQADTIDSLVDKLNRYRKIHFNRMSENGISNVMISVA